VRSPPLAACLLLVSFDAGKRFVGGGAFAALSSDDGWTWPHVRKLEGVTGDLAAAQGPDGVVHVAGSRLGASAFNEAWLKESR
jgi:hypothetical protein